MILDATHASTQVAIIGAGLAGLNAARLLHRGGVSFQLFEARERPGGRILTLNEQGQTDGDGFDLGPSWFWPDFQPGLSELVTELGLKSFRQQSSGDALYEGSVNERPERFAGSQQEPHSMRLVGGSASLIDALIRDLPPHRLHFGTKVTEMMLTDRDVTLKVSSSRGTEQFVAGIAIAALPPRLLSSTITFHPQPEPSTLQLWNGTPTWMAPHAKFFAIYDRPFWRNAGLSGAAQSMVGPLVEIHDATTASGRPALFGFVGVPAKRRVSVGTEAIVSSCCRQLVRLFGSDAAAPRSTLYTDWANDPFTAAPLDLTSAGHPRDGIEHWISGPWQSRLFFAGSETSSANAGYLAGAVLASQRAVQQILR